MTVIMPEDPGARQDDPPIGPHAAARRVVHRLAGAEPSLVLAVCDDETIRAAVARHVRTLLETPTGPPFLRDARVVQFDALALAASVSGAAGVEAHLRAVGSEAAGEQQASVLIVDGIEALSTSPRAVIVLAALVSRSGVRVAAAADVRTAASLRDGPVAAWVRCVEVVAPPADAATLRPHVERIARHHGTMIEGGAVRVAVELIRDHQPDSPPHAAALDLLDEAAAAAADDHRRAVTGSDIGALYSQRTGIPAARLTAGGTGDLRDLEKRLHERVVGQDAAVAAVAAAVRRRRTGVGDPNRPLGSFLFLGPTGVGKTELARALAAALFADDRALIRLDMGEYQEAHSVARLVGAPPGYIGYGHGGHLSDALRRNPASVVLLDEIEKAHGDVSSVLLALLEDGRLTDGQGRTVDARHAVVIMTSNLGTSGEARQPESAAADLALKAVAERFSPEFRNRIDETVVFARLGEAELRAIVALQLGYLRERLAGRHITLRVTPDACGWLAQRGWDPAYGARPLRREVRRHVEDAIADALVRADLGDGGTVSFDVAAGAQRLTLTCEGRG